MFKVIESVNMSPIRLPVRKDIIVTPGMLIDIVDGAVQYELSDGYKTFGFAGNVIETDIGVMLEVWSNRMIFHTTEFEPGNFNPGNLLYVRQGKLTLKRHKEGILSVARVITGPSKNKPFLEGLYL